MNIILNIVLWITYIISLYLVVFWLIVFLDLKTGFEKQNKKVKLKSYPLVSVIIPAYNEEEAIKVSLNSVINLDYPKDKLEIIVVNDGSTDNTKQVVEKIIQKNKDRRIILINQPNQGKGKALNNGLKIAKGQFFACLDADSYVERSTLKKMLAVYEQESEDLAIVTPAMKVDKPKTIVQKLQKLEYLVAIFMARLMSHLDCIYVAPGPFSLYRTNVIKKLGGFDENNLTEDQEIAYRIQKYNYRIKQCHNGYVYTFAPTTFRQLYKQRNRWLKGSLFNLIKYKKLWFNKKYGDFGIHQINVNISTFFLSVSITLLFLYYTIRPLIRNLHDFYLVKFDIMPYLKTLRFTIDPLSINLSIMFVLWFLCGVALIMFYISHKNANEKIKKQSLIYLFPYFIIYYLVLAFIAVVSIIELLIGKIQKW